MTIRYDNTYITDTNREKTDFGHLKVIDCIITAEGIQEYHGSELPKVFGIKDNKTYKIYRPASEIKKALDSYNNVPLTDEHYFVDGNAVNKNKWIGGVGTDAKFVDGKLINSLAVWDVKAVDLVENHKDGLSAGYSFSLENSSGEFKGEKYDFVMRDIQANHVALVKTPRVPEAKIADNDFLKDIDMNNSLFSWELADKKGKDEHDDLDIEDSKEDSEEASMSTKDKKAKDKKGKDNHDENGFAELEDEEDEEEGKGKDSGYIIDARATDKKSADDMDEIEDSDEDDEKAKDSYDDGDNKYDKAKNKDSRYMSADSIARLVDAKVEERFREFSEVKALCEDALGGRVNYDYTARPISMMRETCKALGMDSNHDYKTTKVLLQNHIRMKSKSAYIEDNKKSYYAQDNKKYESLF